METSRSARKDKPRPPEIRVTVHYAEGGPSLESRMAAVLRAHLTKSGGP